MTLSNLNDKNFLLYAMRHYDNSQCNGIEEFNEDLAIPIHLKKLFTRYHVNGVLKDRLITNHIISFFNVMEPIAAANILFFKIEDYHHSYLKAFLMFLNRCPSSMILDDNLIHINNIPTDIALLNRLRNGMKLCQ